MTNTVRLRISNLSLKEMDSSLLTHAILESTSTLGMDREVVADALVTASYYHRKATRANRANLPRTHYIEHPLRNALRLLRYGVTDQDTILATILHDLVEDCSREITEDILGVEPRRGERSDRFVQDKALEFIKQSFGGNVEDLVYWVTNPPKAKYRTKQEQWLIYSQHVEAAIQRPKVFLVKFSDWADNAVGLHHNDTAENSGMVQNLANKYLPLADIFENTLESLDIESLVHEDGYNKIKAQIESGRKSLTAILKD